MYQQIWNEIKKSEIITIFGHVYPDGDCYGSQMGLKKEILKYFPNKKVYVLGSGLKNYFSLIGKMDVINDEVISKSLAIILDTANVARIEDQRYSLAKKIIKIDHHILQDQYGSIVLIDNTKVATCEIIEDMFCTLNLELSPEVAMPLFLGIITDSGRLSYSPTSSHTYHLCEVLLETKFDVQSLYSILNAVDEKILKFKGYIYSHYRKTKEGVVYLTVANDVCKKYNVDYNLAAVLVNSIENIKGSPIWVFFSESDHQEVRVELRSNRFNINPVAAKFGGGGHPFSSGCKLARLEDYRKVLKELDDLIKED